MMSTRNQNRNASWQTLLHNRIRNRKPYDVVTYSAGSPDAPIWYAEVQGLSSLLSPSSLIQRTKYTLTTAVNGTTWATGQARTKVEAKEAGCKAAVEYGDSCELWNTL
ncbi:hypothetical protein AMATHDRAFT_7244 [Amanita thiersii Skay4041]|uniref:Uncharacterized protein n=1 Tax=Amanita thiersii Skay4041 TaxID=703135 RepID=A0A2A9NC70_9AGAR|nr:hypothetical protein AMATHDRAFT_7244 [Amanita thiersii Skay4041]